MGIRRAERVQEIPCRLLGAFESDLAGKESRNIIRSRLEVAPRLLRNGNPEHLEQGTGAGLRQTQERRLHAIHLIQERAGRVALGELGAIRLEPEEEVFRQRGFTEGLGNLLVRRQQPIRECLGGNVFGLFWTVCIEQFRHVAKRLAVFGQRLAFTVAEIGRGIEGDAFGRGDTQVGIVETGLGFLVLGSPF